MAPADLVAIVADTPAAAVTAGEVVKARLAPRVVLFAPPDDKEQEILRPLGITSPARHELLALVLERLGVPSPAILVIPLDEKGTNAVVRAVARYAERAGQRRIIAVAHRSHTRRTAILLRRELGAGRVVIVRAAPQDPFHADTWWHQRDTARELALEALRWTDSLVLGGVWRR